MKRFTVKILIFLLPAFIVFVFGLFLPTTPRASKSLLMSSLNKNSLLQNTASPRIIFVGGSNLSFGLNSQMIKDSLRLNPINTSIHASIGIKYMIDNTLEYIQKGDIVVLVPEYSHYHRSLYSGSEELMRTVFDVSIANMKYLNVYQILNISSFLPKYSLTKFNISEYLNVKESDVYSVNSFNKYGDTYTHWGMKQQYFAPSQTIGGKYNYEVIRYFEEFSLAVKNKGATLLVSFPSFQETSYHNSVNQIFKVEQELKNSNLTIIGSAERYKMSDSLMFNTPYHLNKSGVDYRTKMIIEDIKEVLYKH
jgi:hypothetical protein